jgi:hypothetical protein
MYLSDTPEPTPAGATPIVLEGIVRQRCISATYNRMAVVLAPHVLFMKNDALYVGAVTIERDGQPPREPKFGLFKLDGLVGLAPTERNFEISPLFERDDERFAATALMAVEG